jgi:hypothetical protein
MNELAMPLQAAGDRSDADGDKDSNSPRTRSPSDQVKVWEEEGGSPPARIGATASIKPRRGSKAGSMGGARS